MARSHEGTDAPIFFETYAQCREAFLATATRIGAQVEGHLHPDCRGPDGSELAIDIAFFGPRDARRLFVLSSGTHGCEGFAGSAVQLNTMRRLDELMGEADDTALLFVHGVNPYGWAYFSRTNENQVDLNRNFIDFGAKPPEHSLAPDIQRLSTYSTVKGPDLEKIIAGFSELAEIHGLEAAADALQCGQYFQTDGVGFGGLGEQWSNVTMRSIWSKYLGGRDKIGWIDLHTGLGRYGEPVILNFDPPGTTAHNIVLSWWGEAALAASNAAFRSGARPNYSGLLLQAAQDTALTFGSVLAGAVIEFGTFAPIEAAKSLWIDRWLRNLPDGAETNSVERLRAEALRFFYPNEIEWNHKVLENGWRIIAPAFREFAR
ncbi:DUF2817 domain-containing protein [Sphingomonas suaedae]|uniref:DUF2817 domain-containing protein n=1 Tax=Sphingomonas suaedae TaxID=2599297 RepID=A0A518RHJ9_9SPHN|nr:DUF2817 domain-containing protein [Sphingomonas suaedae]QDX26912.1 DUF2817 domain-containing protein [Sphingomonas suaedae]